MKRIDFNKIIFVAIFVIIIAGLFSVPVMKSVYGALRQFAGSGDFIMFTDEIDEASKKMTYKEKLIDLNSIVGRLTGVRKIEKDDENVLRLENDYLYYERKKISDELVNQAADSCIALKNKSEEQGSYFTYVYVPEKAYFDNKTHIEYKNSVDGFLEKLDNGGVRILNIAEKLKEQGKSMEDAYYITDHHWKAETGFWATGLICEELKQNAGFTYDENFMSLENYDVKTYEDWFLGSQGKKVGRYFTSLGFDDFTLITPKFKTDLSVTYRGENRKGEFKESVLNLNHLNTKDHYNKNCYATYSDGDFPEQIIENNLSTDDGKKILVIRDSAACCVTPYLSLAAKTTRIIDIRNMHCGQKGYVESVYNYIEEFKPDYVIVIYMGLNIGERNASKYNFK